jgi:hypothetical protein
MLKRAGRVSAFRRTVEHAAGFSSRPPDLTRFLA